MKQSRNIGYCEETRQFYHSERADFCVYADGRVTRTWKKSQIEELVKVYLKRGKASLKCGQKEFIRKHVVAAAFLPGYKKGANVICVDGDELNCAVDNLCVMSKQQLGRLTGYKAKSYAVAVKEPNTGRVTRFRSVRDAAKSLHCSYQTVLDHMKGKWRNGCLCGYVIERIKD